MQVKKKTAWGLAAIVIGWEFVLQPIWNLNIERVAEANEIDGTLADTAPMTLLRDIATYLPSSFTAGFVIGALIFAYWDNILAVWRRWRGTEAPPDRRAWVGKIWPNFNEEQREAELWFSVITVGDVPLRPKRVEGSVTLRAGHKVFEFANPRFTETHEDFADRGYVRTFPIAFSSDRKFWEVFPELFIWTPRSSMKLENLKLVFETPGGDEKEIKLWNSMRLTAGEDQICAVETFPVFKSEEERERMQKALGAVVKRFGAKL